VASQRRVPIPLVFTSIIIVIILVLMIFFPAHQKEIPPFYWTTVQGDIARSGNTHFSPPLSANTLWSVNITLSTQPGKEVSSCIAYDKVFLGVEKSVRALSLSDGSVEWKPPGFRVENSFIVGNEKVYCGRESSIVAIRVDDASTAWRWDISGYIDTSGVVHPIHYMGNVYASYDSWKDFPTSHVESIRLVCVDAESGQQRFIYEYVGSEWFSHMAAAGGRIYVANQTSLLCINAANGAIAWESYCGGNLQEKVISPVVAGDSVLLGTGEALYCFEASSGELKWSHPGSFSRSSVCVGGGHAYGLIPEEGAYGLDWSEATLIALSISDGDVAWTMPIQTYNKYDAPSPLILMKDGIVIALGREVRLYSASNGNLVWTYDLEDSRMTWAFLSAADRCIIAISEGHSGGADSSVDWVRITAIG